ncbi:MAG TPA: M28 family peptidase, partial [Chitinispirillaceae bacterium]|nr:M28 family peptidase [Chitinispirillaceae bacterium]
MCRETLLKLAEDHLKALCSDIRERRVGGEGNREATNYVKNHFKENGWCIEETELSVIDWKTEGASLHCNDTAFEVFSSPYSLGCYIQGILVPVDTVEKLKNTELTEKIVLMHGKIAAEQIMPKNFVFYNPDEHKEIVSVLEKGMPGALICATGRNSTTAGGAYPFPLFEDGDFDIPSVYMKDTEGEKLIACSGQQIILQSKSLRIPETAYNIVARSGDRNKKRIVVTAHIDAKAGTPGAIDNATGVTVLLLLCGLLQNYKGNYCIEIVAFNGEDYYAVPGQMKYIEQNGDKFQDVVLNINIDGVGYKNGLTCFSPFDLPVEIHSNLNELITNNTSITEGAPWVQGDHSIFLQFGCPAIAVSSNWLIENFDNQDITHTPKDNLSIVSYERVVECAL